MSASDRIIPASLAEIPNLSSRAADGRIIHHPVLPMEDDLDTIPYPDLSLLKPDPRRRKFPAPNPVQTSRGCPFDCSFCSVTGMFGKKYRFRSTENIIEELRRYDHLKNAVFFYDDNFAANTQPGVPQSRRPVEAQAGRQDLRGLQGGCLPRALRRRSFDSRPRAGPA